jgi:hypothetical protein
MIPLHFFQKFFPVIWLHRNAGGCPRGGGRAKAEPQGASNLKNNFSGKIEDRFSIENRILINPINFSIAIMIAITN